jgi:hypothetical protein
MLVADRDAQDRAVAEHEANKAAHAANVAAHAGRLAELDRLKSLLAA